MTVDSDRVVDEVKGGLQANEKVAVVVLGMHRSGTSALARVLNLLGCSMPQRIMDGNESNLTGHWESEAIVELNDEILEASGSAWNDWQQLNPGWEKSPARAGFMRKAALILQSEYGESSFFVVKDPRICRIAPFWLDVLKSNNIEPKIVIPVRHPGEVAASLHKRDGMDPSLGYLIWLRQVLDAERGSRGHQRVFTTYDQLLKNWSQVTSQIAEGLDISWPRYSLRVVAEIEGFLDKRQRNHNWNDQSGVTGSVIPRWVRETYTILSQWAQGDENSDDFADLDAISEALDEAALSFGMPLTLFQQVTEHLRIAQTHVVEADRDRDAAIDRANDAERLLHERGEVQDKVAAAEQLLHERGEELASIKGRNSELQIELDSSYELALSVEQELIQSRRECKEVVGKKSELESHLLQRKEELRQVWADLEAAQTELKNVRVVLEDRQKSLEQARIDSAASKEKLEALEAELEKTHAVARSAVSQRSQAFNEIAIVTQFLRDSEHDVQKRDETLQWLSQVHAVMLRRPRWWFFLSRKAQFKRLSKRVEQRGMFDSDAYLARNPDVAASGVDPLRHYITHGVKESRTR